MRGGGLVNDMASWSRPELVSSFELVSNKSIEINLGCIVASESLKELKNSSMPRNQHVDEKLKD